MTPTINGKFCLLAWVRETMGIEDVKVQVPLLYTLAIHCGR